MTNRLFASTALTVLVGLCAPGSVLAQAAAPQGNADAAKSKISMCIGCHGIPGYKTTFPEVYSVPAIGGQSAGYLASALHAYAKGDRRHPTMRGIAKSLSDQDILDIAAYYSKQQ